MQLLPLIQQTLSPNFSAVSVQEIKASGNPARIYRLRLEPVNGVPAPESVILKRILPDWPADRYGADREANCYALIADQGLTPRVLFNGCAPESRERLLLLEDLTNFRFPPDTHRWTMGEAESFIPTYARLHACRLPADQHADWLFPRLEQRIMAEPILTAYRQLVNLGAWTPIPQIKSLLAWVHRSMPAMLRLPAVLLHIDVFPPNIALPKSAAESARLIDWEMAGLGMAETDLAFMFLQPYRSAENLDRSQVLRAYWKERQKLEGKIPDPAQRRRRQFYADALWGLWLIPVAHRSVIEPFAEGSVPHRYWLSMRGVLHAWLTELSRAISRMPVSVSD